MSKLAEPVLTQPQSLLEFINTLPSPLTTALVSLAPSLARLRRALQIFSWKSAWEESWIAIAVWWVLCLFLQPALRYFLPLIVLCVIVTRNRYSKLDTVQPLVTEDTLQTAVSDLLTIRALFPSLPPRAAPVRLLVLLRVGGILYVPYLALTHFVSLRILLAITGTLVLAHRSRWASLLRRALWRSAYVRWATYRTWSLLSGLPSPTHPAATAAAQTLREPGAAAETQQLRFLFTVYENQRWWMGLDWTAALLPGERPAWCGAAQQPAAPPAAFALPASKTVFMRGPDGARVQRTARWGWAEPEWRVVVHRENGASVRVERPLPTKEEGAGAAAILRAAGKMREGSIGGGGSPERHKRGESLGGGTGTREADEEEEDPHTDEDGWVYADNKWEGESAKGGMGKYTRYRRWTRIAILTETVEPAPETGEVGIRIDEKPDMILSSPLVTSPTSAISEASRDAADIHDEEDRSRLRRRLQAAVMSAAHT